MSQNLKNLQMEQFLNALLLVLLQGVQTSLEEAKSHILKLQNIYEQNELHL